MSAIGSFRVGAAFCTMDDDNDAQPSSGILNQLLQSSDTLWVYVQVIKGSYRRTQMSFCCRAGSNFPFIAYCGPLLCFPVVNSILIPCYMLIHDFPFIHTLQYADATPHTAKNLKGVDFNGKSDPFVVIRQAGIDVEPKSKSKYISNNLNPEVRW